MCIFSTKHSNTTKNTYEPLNQKMKGQSSRKQVIKTLMRKLYEICPLLEIGMETASVVQDDKFKQGIRSMFYSELAAQLSQNFIKKEDNRHLFNNFVIINKGSFRKEERKQIDSILKECDCISKINSEYLLRGIITDLLYNNLRDTIKEN